MVRRLAVERRAASTINSAINSNTTGAGAETAGDERVRPNGHVYKYDYANTAAGAAFESSGRTLEEEQRALREQSNEVRFKAAGRTFCSPSPRFSPHAW